jgi:hypothetical protein
MTYSQQDLQVLSDAVEHIRKRPHMYVRDVTGIELATTIAREACVLTDAPVTLVHKGPWWIVAGEADWLATQPRVSIPELFTHIIAFPEAGPNSMRGEVLLSAFASDVLTTSRHEHCVIKGTATLGPEIAELLQARPQWKRVVLFRMEVASASDENEA